jgi:hypothetical protein
MFGVAASRQYKLGALGSAYGWRANTAFRDREISMHSQRILFPEPFFHRSSALRTQADVNGAYRKCSVTKGLLRKGPLSPADPYIALSRKSFPDMAAC